MGKSGGRKKKGGLNANQVSVDNNSSNKNSHVNGGVDLDSSVFLKRANELKEEGNVKYQNKDYMAALQLYDNALRLIPKTHPDRAVFHSNRAACLMQMKPIDYDAVIAECNMAIQAQPLYVRALLRRARAFEAVGKYEMAMQDVQLLLGAEPNNKDALEIGRRLRTALGPRLEAQQDLQSRPSPAALGASAVRGAPIAGLGPCLPARPVPKKTSTSPPRVSAVSPNNKLDKHQMNVAPETGSKNKNQLPKLMLKPSSGSSKATDNPNKDGLREKSFSTSMRGQVPEVAIQWRPLKLVYDHDIRLSQMPVNCSFKVLREIVSKRFPSSKSVLIKYKDNDGDLVTITCTTELRLAESSVDALVPIEPQADKTSGFGTLRLHIVEVSPEQEPPLPEEEVEKPLESQGAKSDESVSHSSLGDSVSEGVDVEIEKTEKESSKGKIGANEDPECKEVEMDDWLFEFAQLFRTNVGIDPDAHIDLHELGMEHCSEALEETVTSEEAQVLFDKAAAKFQEVAALAFFNWGNVHMCSARKRIPLDESAGKEVVSEKLQTAYDWVGEKYSLAREKYAEALSIKPDFYEGGSKATDNPNKDGLREKSFSISMRGQVPEVAIQWRPLKLVYDHDIRLSQMPVNCSFKVLREIVSKRFPSSKSVLIKYKDNDGDLVTITCTTELRLAESSVDALVPIEPQADKTSGFGTLRLHIVEVSPEQEPPLPEEEEEKPLESQGAKSDESVSHSSLGDSVSEGVDVEIEKTEKESSKGKIGANEDPECKEVEMDDWLFEFAQLFRTNVGIDPDAHIDLHELGMEHCSEALEETVTSEEAQVLFDKAAAKFQEVAALAFFNWGNVHMCSARKRIPLDESAGKEVVSEKLQTAYDWVGEKYSLAREKYAEALSIKPDFYEGLLALGQQHFEMAKLNWSFALAKKIDLSTWDPAETLQLFNSAEEMMKDATEMWEKLEQQRVNELKDPNSGKKEELLKIKKKLGSGAENELPGTGNQCELSAEEVAEQAAVMRSQIHLFWGNMLFERSQVECKLGMDGWKKNLNTAVERFKLAGASEADISTVLKNHCSNGDAVEGDEKKVVGDVNQISDK
ncbi:hypothetical protein GOBAR_AA24785 [Gossypium barbadense]|uniref:PB1 domain-containing protein n=1 Tax=Gossypium barbadense TaxID=3634 RepID=A0A2P5WXS7_GOSBA|nr:hypothetical protein GOBAR_AA24785 [Gossypium barbadense]